MIIKTVYIKTLLFFVLNCTRVENFKHISIEYMSSIVIVPFILQVFIISVSKIRIPVS